MQTNSVQTLNLNENLDCRGGFRGWRGGRPPPLFFFAVTCFFLFFVFLFAITLKNYKLSSSLINACKS